MRIVIAAVTAVMLLVSACTSATGATRIPGATLIPAATRIPPATLRPNSLLEINGLKCIKGEYGFAYLRGEVHNVSNTSLENVMAVASWYTDDGTFITSHEAMIAFNPILPGQSSPFETIGTLNPAMARCKLAFKTLFGGQLSYRIVNP